MAIFYINIGCVCLFFPPMYLSALYPSSCFIWFWNIVVDGNHFYRINLVFIDSFCKLTTRIWIYESKQIGETLLCLMHSISFWNIFFNFFRQFEIIHKNGQCSNAAAPIFVHISININLYFILFYSIHCHVSFKLIFCWCLFESWLSWPEIRFVDCFPWNIISMFLILILSLSLSVCACFSLLFPVHQIWTGENKSPNECVGLYEQYINFPFR